MGVCKPGDGKEVRGMVNTQGHYNKLKFSYESDTAASFLVIQYDEKVTDYQLRMLEHNSVKYVISPEMVRKEGVASFYYNITSMISLSFFLKRQKLSREQFLRLVLQIASSVNNSSGYLLDPKSFIFNIEYIYINPETLEPALVYIPAEIDQSGGTTLQSFISELLMMHIQAEGFDKGNFVQRILSVVKSETFNLKACVGLMNELMYGPEQSMGSTQNKRGESKKEVLKKEAHGKKGPEKIESFTTNATTNNYIKVKKEERKKEKEKERSINGYLIVVLVITLQFAMGSIIYMSREFLEKVGENKTVTYAAVLMIVLAVDVLIFKKIYDSKLINVKKIEPKPENQMQGLKPGSYGTQASDKVEGKDDLSVDEGIKCASPGNESGSGNMVGDRMAAAGSGSGSTSRRIACKTELLGKDAKGTLTLRSTGKHGSDEDIVLDKDDFVIGRLAGHVDHVINNNAVGKLHAQVICKNGICLVKDLNSMNGTFINNTRIESNKEFELQDNNRLRLANCEFVLVRE